MVILTAINPPTDGIRHKQTDTAAYFGENDLGVGTLYISESFLIWISNDGRGFSLPYPTISMHAVSRDPRTAPRPCIFMILDPLEEKSSGRETGVSERFAEKMAACDLKTESTASKTETAASGASEGEHNGSAREESEGEGDDDDHRSAEVRFVPADGDSLETMYHALSECQALHPDENESFSDDDEDADFGVPQMGGASDEFRFDDSGQLVLSRMRGVRTDDAMEHEYEPEPPEDDDEEMETGQFEDAPE